MAVIFNEFDIQNHKYNVTFRYDFSTWNNTLISNVTNATVESSKIDLSMYNGLFNQSIFEVMTAISQYIMQ